MSALTGVDILSLGATTNGAMAADPSAQVRGYGAILLADAVETTRASIGAVDGIALFADAIDERATAFYQRFGFESFRDDPLSSLRAVAWP